MDKVDVLVVGAGVNSLVCASMMAQAGKRVLVVEARDQVGGLAGNEDSNSGFKYNLVYDYVDWFDHRVMSKLDLAEHGLEFHTPEVIRIALDPNGKHITFCKDVGRTAASIGAHSEKDAENWVTFSEHISSLSHFIEKLYAMTPPKLPKMGLQEAFSFAPILRPFKKHGMKGVVDLMRSTAMTMPDLMDEWFESDFLRGSLSTAGIRHLTQGPFSAGTGLNLLHKQVHSKGVFHNALLVKGGMNKLILALKSSAKTSGVAIRNGSSVRSINVSANICRGVTLENNQTIEADCVISGLDPRNTFLNLVGAQALNHQFQKQVSNIKFRGSTLRIHFLLNQLPNIKGVKEENMNAIFMIDPSLQYLEKAYDATKYGKIPEKPFIEFSFPSIDNEDLCDHGKQVLSATVQYVPFRLRGEEWNAAIEERIKQIVLSQLEIFIPGILSMIEYTVVNSPVRLEEQLGISEGNVNHGEMTLDQFFFMRPTVSAAQYKSPIQHLYLCGPGTHPGGGLHGANGFNAATEII